MNTPKHLGINGLFLRKPGTGIGQVSHFLLQEFSKGVAKDLYTLYVDTPDTSFPVPEGSQVVFIRPWWQRDDLIRKLLWEHIQLPKRALADGVTHFLSLYQAPTEFPYRIRHTMVVHDMISELFPVYRATIRSRFMWNLTKRAIARASALIAVSKSTSKDILTFGPVAAEKITLAYPSINPLFFAEKKGAKTEEVLSKYALAPGYLYHGGGLEIRKNTESVLTAYAAWRQAEPEGVPPLVISGFIHEESNPLATDVRGCISKLGLEGVVRLLGFVPDEDLPALYSEASLFLFPSRYEGFGMPVVEALSQGTAVIAEKNSSLGEVGGDSVFWVEALTRESLQKSYQQALQSSEEERSVRILQAKNFSSWNQFAQKIIGTLI